VNFVPVPHLIHPVVVKIEQLQRSLSIVDDDFREPIQQARRGPVKSVLGQIKWSSDEQLEISSGGAREGADGYVLFRRHDLIAAGLNEIHQNDRITSMGSGGNVTLVDLYITRVQQMGHYPGGATLVRAWFKDRQPSKQTRGGGEGVC
jgi:hypothetical protein